MSDEGGFPYWDSLISWHCDLICFSHTHIYKPAYLYIPVICHDSYLHIHLYKESVTGCKFIIFPNTTQQYEQYESLF